MKLRCIVMQLFFWLFYVTAAFLQRNCTHMSPNIATRTVASKSNDTSETSDQGISVPKDVPEEELFLCIKRIVRLSLMTA